MTTKLFSVDLGGDTVAEHLAIGASQPDDTVLLQPAPAADQDADDVNDLADNCVDTANVNQQDADGDGVGDICDLTDADGDEIQDGTDNCPDIDNVEQSDLDSNGIGDLCEPAIAEP